MGSGSWALKLNQSDPLPASPLAGGGAICEKYIIVLEYFSGLMGEYQNRINVSLLETDSLTQLRDTLLPKLISGELALDALPEAHELVEAR